MKPAYLTLDNGKTVRIMWNMNATGEFTKITGRDLADLDDGRADVNQLRTIGWCSAVEGEDADGKDLGMTEKEFGRQLSLGKVVELAKIIVEQSGNDGQKKSPARKEIFPKIHFRKKE
jgi:hypothetical protein